MINTRECIKTISDLLRLPSYHRLNPTQIENLSYLSDLCHKLFISREVRESPKLGINIKLVDLQRVKSSSVADIIIYIMQINKSPVSFKETHKLVSRLKKYDTRSLVNVSFRNLIKKGFISRTSYATYELTEVGRNEFV